MTIKQDKKESGKKILRSETDHRKRNRVRIGYAAKIALGIIAVGGVVAVAAMFPGMAILMKSPNKRTQYNKKQYATRTIESLVKNKLVKYVTASDGTLCLELTRKGNWEAGMRGVSERTKNASKWDRKWRVIIFDVPVTKNRMRNELRRAVILRGFYQLQKSVWVYPYPCDDFVSLVKNHLKISGEVLYMQVSYLENDKHLVEHFNL